ncbi:MAG: Ig-like domain-containing protein [Lachnospiraceae bacterium]|nr:Ig-like domain-containing protein [Lachnospiraceae bacterium]
MVLALTLALSVTSVATGETAASAKVKLNKTKYTLRVGKKLKLKVKGTKKKAKWSSSKKKVATVSKKGVVTAKKAGKTTITAKVGKKKLSCKITVTKKNADNGNSNNNSNNNSNADANKSNEELAKSLKVTAEQAADGSVLFSIKNNNKATVNYASLTATWKDVKGKENKKELTVYFLPAGETCYLAAKRYTDDSGDVLTYTKQDLSTMTYSAITVNKTYAETKDVTSTATITNNPLEAGKTWASVKIENTSTIRYDYMDMTVGLYNAAGQLVAVESQNFLQDEDPYMNPGSRWTFSYDFPQDFVQKSHVEVSSYKRLYIMIRSNAQ